MTCSFLNTTGILQNTGVEVEQETSAPPRKKNPVSAPGLEISNSELSNISETTIIRNIPKKEEYAKLLKKDLGGCLWSFFAVNTLKVLWMNKNVFLCT